jgi:hypothetical protein
VCFIPARRRLWAAPLKRLFEHFLCDTYTFLNLFFGKIFKLVALLFRIIIHSFSVFLTTYLTILDMLIVHFLQAFFLLFRVLFQVRVAIFFGFFGSLISPIPASWLRITYFKGINEGLF